MKLSSEVSAAAEEEVPPTPVLGRDGAIDFVYDRLGTAGDAMIHKSVARAVNDLREFLEVERKPIPGNSCLRRIGSSSSPSLGTIGTSMAMSLPAYEPCSCQTVPPGVINLPFATGQNVYFRTPFGIEVWIGTIWIGTR